MGQCQVLMANTYLPEEYFSSIGHETLYGNRYTDSIDSLLSDGRLVNRD